MLIKTSCSSVSYTTDKLSLSFGDAYGNEVNRRRFRTDQLFIPLKHMINQSPKIFMCVWFGLIGVCIKNRWSRYKDIREMFQLRVSGTRPVYGCDLLSILSEEWIWRLETREYQDLRPWSQNNQFLFGYLSTWWVVVWD